MPDEMYLTDAMLDMIAIMRQRPIDDMMKSHLLRLFGKDGEALSMHILQQAEHDGCPFANTQNCTCGFCAPYRDGPLLDEVISELQSFERGEYIIDGDGKVVIPVPPELPF